MSLIWVDARETLPYLHFLNFCCFHPFPYTTSTSISLHWIVMNGEHGCPDYSFSSMWRLVIRVLPRTLPGIRGSLSIYYVSPNRRQQSSEQLMSGMGRIYLLIMEGSRWLGDNSMRWTVRWNHLVRNRSGDVEGETRKLTSWAPPSPALRLFLPPCTIPGPVLPYSHYLLTHLSPSTRLQAPYKERILPFLWLHPQHNSQCFLIYA